MYCIHSLSVCVCVCVHADKVFFCASLTHIETESENGMYGIDSAGPVPSLYIPFLVIRGFSTLLVCAHVYCVLASVVLLSNLLFAKLCILYTVSV